ncbi:hypothetical protein LSM04_004529 [Trypanosoma melophagium]|uniref:uncharacterized protein n=1 Tax=Trypanosoma melophagium TaxID=715481 RepID=UPI00351A7477|nr:hypothetical protein LSM04_004529 [Trypanosoma melophagium]
MSRPQRRLLHHRRGEKSKGRNPTTSPTTSGSRLVQTGCRVSSFPLSFSPPLSLSSSKSLSMIFQASSFSASGRKVPLEPRRSEACRPCQPMHVLSFGEGRKKWLCFCVDVLLCDVHVWSACRAATVVGQEFRPGQRDCVWSAIPFKMSLQACLYIGAPRRREPSRLECPSPECKS